ncbi:MAG: UDP-N-acetylmuramoyl-L-alanyl-D-glutamate--2,6-diaminopimelate ligase, partial [Tidjanibacter sp.]|nr:UDP-N-acetylmuramoyl-L-alanyl-D-glutamate--2,6-diaminopimelate ligase [Tidjanibacter sp.]
MKLNKLLERVEVIEIVGSGECEITTLTMDSRKACPGALFAAIEGTAVDGHAYIGKAVEAGASAVLCNHLPAEVAEGCTYVVVADSSRAIGLVAANFYDRPSEKLALVGVTGTNGKTTTATLLYQMTEKLGYKAGLISTVIYKIGDQEEPST